LFSLVLLVRGAALPPSLNSQNFDSGLRPALRMTREEKRIRLSPKRIAVSKIRSNKRNLKQKPKTIL